MEESEVTVPANDNRLMRYAARLARRTRDAYSAERFQRWEDCALALEASGLSVAVAETILRSRLTRWAADHSERLDYKPRAGDLLAFMAAQPGAVLGELGRQFQS